MRIEITMMIIIIMIMIKIEKDVMALTLAIWVYRIENHVLLKAHESTVKNDLLYGN